MPHRIDFAWIAGALLLYARLDDPWKRWEYPRLEELFRLVDWTDYVCAPSPLPLSQRFFYVPAEAVHQAERLFRTLGR